MKPKYGFIAYGYYVKDTNCFVLGSGSHFPAEVSENFHYNKVRDELINVGCERIDNYYKATVSFLFDSPSAAASVVKGYSANGYNLWEVIRGDTLDGKSLVGMKLKEAIKYIN